MNMIRRISEWICGPERSWVEEEAYLEGYKAQEGEPNPFNDFKARRAWREGKEASEDWKARW